MANDQVRFVRIRGRIVPIRQTAAHKTAQKRQTASAYVAGAGTAASVPFLGAAAHQGYAKLRGIYLKRTGITALKGGRLFKAAKVLRSAAGNKFSVTRRISKAVLGSRLAAIPLGVAAAGYLAMVLTRPRSKR